jgi:hypothetical protein
MLSNANVGTYTYGPDGARQTKTVGGVETFYAGMAEIRDLGGAGEQIILQPHADFRYQALAPNRTIGQQRCQARG